MPASPALPSDRPLRRHGVLAAGPGFPDALPATFLRTVARLGPAFPLEALGWIGDDDAGQALADELCRYKIDTIQLRPAPAGETAARLGPADFDLSASNAKILHLGRPLQLAGLDAPARTGGTGWSALGLQARAAGIRVSLAVADGPPAALRAIVTPLLPLLTYLVLDAGAAATLTGETLRSAPGLSVAGVEKAAGRLIAAGVSRWVIIHAPRAVFALNPSGFAVWQPTVELPARQAETPAFADAFAAGIFFAVHDHWPMDEALKIGVAAAAAHVLNDGRVPPLKETVALAQQTGFHPAITRGQGFI